MTSAIAMYLLTGGEIPDSLAILFFLVVCFFSIIGFIAFIYDCIYPDKKDK